MKHSSRKVLENHERFTTVSLYMPSTYMIVTPLHHPPAPTNKSSSSSSSSNHLMNNNKSSSTPTPNFDSSMALTILVLVTAIFFMGFFSVYLRCFARVSSTQEQQVSLRLRRNRRRNNQTSSSSGVQESSSHHHQQHHIHHGLDPSTVGSLPLVLAAHVVTRNKAKETVVDCAVCLSEFQDTEMVKMIPFCEHVFHPQCIDMWFLSHSSCPLCRSTKLFPPPPPPVNNSSNSSVIVNNKVDAAAAPLSLISTTTELEDREVLIDDDDDRKSLDLESTVVVDQDEVIVMMVGADNKLRLMTMRRTCSCSSLLSGMRSSVHDQVLLHDESLQRSSSSRWF